MANTGNYTVVVSNPGGSVTSSVAVLTVNPAASGVIINSSVDSATYGESVIFTATVTPGTATGTVVFKDGMTVLGTNAVNGAGVANFTTAALTSGTHTISAEYSGDSNYLGSTNTVTLTVAASLATVTLSNTNQIYNGTSKAVTVITAPAGVLVTTTYNGNANPPVNVGTYAVVANVSDSNYTGSATGTLTITKGAATISLSPLLQLYNGTARTVTASTTPGGLSVNLTYNGSAQTPTNLGTYVVVGIVTNANYTGALTNVLVVAPGGVLFAWGYGSDGELGTGVNTNTLAPIAVNTNGVLAGKSLAAVAAGQSYSLALTLDGKVFGWGYNGHGQLGNNSQLNSSVPVAAVMNGALAGHPVVTLAGGSGHSVALAADGRVFTWGWNPYGQLGNNSTNDSFVPVAVDTSGALAGKIVTSVASGGNHVLALTSDGQVFFAWGNNQYGQLGNNSTNNSSVPVAVDVSGALAGKQVTSIVAGENFSLAITSGGQVFGWGFNVNGQLGNGSGLNSLTPVAANTSGLLSGKTIQALAAGLYHTLALSTDGQLFAWGGNYNGQLGNNTNAESHVPVAVQTNGALAGKRVVSLAAGYAHSLALTSDRQAFAWGRNQYSQLGNNSTNESWMPVAVSSSGALFNKGVTALASGTMASHTLALATILPNVAPVPPNQSVVIPEDTATNLVLNAADANGDPLIYAILANPTNGTLGALNSSSGAVTYAQFPLLWIRCVHLHRVRRKPDGDRFGRTGDYPREPRARRQHGHPGPECVLRGQLQSFLRHQHFHGR